MRLLFSWHSCRHIWQLLQYDGNSYLLFSTISYHLESSSKYSIHLLWFCDDKNFFDFFAVFFAQNYCSYILEKMETGTAWQIIFVTPNDVGAEQNKWAKSFDVDKEERRQKNLFSSNWLLPSCLFVTVQERRIRKFFSFTYIIF